MCVCSLNTYMEPLLNVSVEMSPREVEEREYVVQVQHTLALFPGLPLGPANVMQMQEKLLNEGKAGQTHHVREVDVEWSQSDDRPPLSM